MDVAGDGLTGMVETLEMPEATDEMLDARDESAGEGAAARVSLHANSALPRHTLRPQRHGQACKHTPSHLFRG